MGKKALIISGGGSYGAYGAGTIAALNKDYDLVGGISTGALITPLAALKEWDRLKEGYTSTNQYDVFDHKWYLPNPVNKKGKINVAAIIMSLLRSKPTVGTTNALRKTIGKFFTYEDFLRLKESKKEIIVGAQNIKEVPSKLHYFSLSDMEYNEKGYEDFKDWMWASTSVPFLTTIVDKENGLWVDGGLTELVPFELAAKGNTYSEIDVIIHRRKEYDLKPAGVRNVVQNVDVTMDAMRYDIEFENLYNRAKAVAKKGKKVRFYYIENGNNMGSSMLFNSQTMKKWWEDGYATAFDESRILNF